MYFGLGKARAAVATVEADKSAITLFGACGKTGIEIQLSTNAFIIIAFVSVVCQRNGPISIISSVLVWTVE